MAARSALGFVREGKPAPHPATRNNRLERTVTLPGAGVETGTQFHASDLRRERSRNRRSDDGLRRFVR
jgi:hypothetical protein